MAITAKQSGETREPVPAGNYFGVIVGVYDLGTQEGGKFGPKHQVVIQFELHSKKGVKTNKEGKPLLMSKFYNLAFGTKADLRADVESILNRAFSEEEAKEGYDVTQLIDQACRLTVKHDKREDNSVSDFINTISPLDDDDPDLHPESDSIVYELDPGKDFADNVPEWIRKKVRLSQEWKETEKTSGRERPAAGNGRQAARGGGRQTAAAAATATAEDDDDTPF